MPILRLPHHIVVAIGTAAAGIICTAAGTPMRRQQIFCQYQSIYPILLLLLSQHRIHELRAAIPPQQQQAARPPAILRTTYDVTLVNM